MDEDYWAEIADKRRNSPNADNRAGGDVDEDYWDEIEDKQAEFAQDPTGREPEAPSTEDGEGDGGGAEETRGAAGEEPGDGLSDDALGGGQEGGEEQPEP